jgi:hypothetical protein
VNGHDISQLVYIVVIALFAIGRAVMRGRSGSSPTPPATGAPSRPPANTELERQRRFREALGLPPDTATPPLVQRRPLADNPPPLQPIRPMGAPSARLGDPNSPRRIYTGVPRRTNAPAPVTPQRAPVVPPPAAAPIPVSWVPESPQTIIAPAPVAPPAPLSPVRQTVTPAPAAPAPNSQQTFPASALLRSLRDPASIRKAIILREVLGLPKALQPSLIGAGTLWSGH